MIRLICFVCIWIPLFLIGVIYHPFLQYAIALAPVLAILVVLAFKVNTRRIERRWPDHAKMFLSNRQRGRVYIKSVNGSRPLIGVYKGMEYVALPPGTNSIVATGTNRYKAGNMQTKRYEPVIHTADARQWYLIQVHIMGDYRRFLHREGYGLFEINTLDAIPPRHRPRKIALGCGCAVIAMPVLFAAVFLTADLLYPGLIPESVPKDDDAIIHQTYTPEELVAAFPAYQEIFDQVDLFELYNQIDSRCDGLDWTGAGTHWVNGEYLILADPASDERATYSTYYDLPNVVSIRSFNETYVSLPENCKMIRTSELPDLGLSDLEIYPPGIYRVGVDVAPGEYFYILNYQHTFFPPLSAFGRSSPNMTFGYLKFSASAEYINLSDYILVSLDAKPDIEVEPGVELPSGMYLVGKDLPAGTYKIESIRTPEGYRNGREDWSTFAYRGYVVYDDVGYVANEQDAWRKSTSISRRVSIHLEEGQYINLTNCTITLVEISD